MTITLNKNETNLLLDAAGGGGTIIIPDTTRPATRQRLIGRLERGGLITAQGEGHMLTPAGYRAVGVRPPRQRRAEPVLLNPTVSSEPARSGTKLALILDLLGRGEGASIDDLIAATGWLPHTTRGALSRLRTSGKVLAKSTREDGKTVYMLEPEPAEAGPKSNRSAPAKAAISETRAAA